jgi:hypothetical protein
MHDRDVRFGEPIKTREPLDAPIGTGTPSSSHSLKGIVVVVRRRSMKMFEHECEFLKAAYLRRGIHLEHYEVRQAELHELCDEWRAHFRRTETDAELFHFMRTKRKKGKWPRLGGAGEPKVALPELGAEHQEVLVDLYYEHVADLGFGSDTLACDAETVAMIETEFEHQTMRRVPGPFLVGILTDLRKRGLLPPVRRHPKDGETGYNDMNSVPV